MSDKRTSQVIADSVNTSTESDDWVTANDLMTDAQHSYLRLLCQQSEEFFDGSLSKAEASRRIEELQSLIDCSPCSNGLIE